jgi:hypothetical protein
MIQTVDPFTLEPLDIAPATGNLDPMHDARSREREIECLGEMAARGAAAVSSPGSWSPPGAGASCPRSG